MRTHETELGANGVGERDFKLVELGIDSEKVLAVWVHSQGVLGRNPQATLGFYVELGRELELLGLAAILGSEDRIRRRNEEEAVVALY